ncbi:MAG: 3-oxoacyl-ACP synthase [Desulfuromonadaceae bacterium GWC2_58_13]|nr:MAG: 3-oxoacyl-ACP synthase [Desulfuromonadaceae bacterium GWC2_58_13]
MLGIEEIGYYIPEGRISNYDRKEQFGIDDHFIEQKIGVRRVSVKGADEDTSDLCVKAFADLRRKTDIDLNDIEAMIVVTQNPDRNIPHASAMLHGKLGLPSRCACFDISLGCSGFVYALSVFQGFMAANGMKKGLLFTSDPYSKIVDPNDKNTSLLFGDAAAVTLVSENPKLVSGIFTFGTLGGDYEKLICNDGVLFMNGRAVFNFAAKVVPEDIRQMVAKNGLTLEKVDRFLLHQGSKIIVETIADKLQIPREKAPYATYDYGNTVSSTLPILLVDELNGPADSIVICGFGVGLSWASGLLKRVK